MQLLDLHPHLPSILNQAKAKHQKVVLVTGVFDLLHSEHHQFLQRAKRAGEVLLVGVESDQRVRRIKGPDRPVQSEQVRATAIEKLGLAAVVFILPTQFDQAADHEALIALLKPSILAVSEHTAHQAQKAAIMAKFGGAVIVVHRHNKSISTTSMLQQAMSLPDTKEKL